MVIAVAVGVVGSAVLGRCQLQNRHKYLDHCRHFVVVVVFEVLEA